MDFDARDFLRGLYGDGPPAETSAPGTATGEPVTRQATTRADGAQGLFCPTPEVGEKTEASRQRIEALLTELHAELDAEADAAPAVGAEGWLGESVEPGEPCPQCGGLMFWWNPWGERRCLACDPPTRAIEVLEQAQRIRRRKRAPKAARPGGGSSGCWSGCEGRTPSTCRLTGGDRRGGNADRFETTDGNGLTKNQVRDRIRR